MNKMWGVFHQQASLSERFFDKANVALLEVSDPTVNELGAP
jgi:hypothetical protein